MDLSHLLLFNAALLAAILSPGPAFVVAMQNTLSSGIRAGIATGLGLGLVGALWTAAALLGLDLVFNWMPWADTAVRACGGLYILYIAYHMWRGAGAPLATVAKPASQAFGQGVMINALNPKTVVFAAAILATIFPPALSRSETALIIANHFLFELSFYAAMAFGLSRQKVRDGYRTIKRPLDRLSAVALGALGAGLMLNR
ncbi:LysE family translocator [Shimia sp. R9_3]|uniref:LysE family translocator n=1 Tax=Shimia sp. R9_3 TaxID=2821113 RepID=UPI001ADCD0B4|nr:LysE family translocator [Shimia sp. R9_3]MBO9400440.1 LysE family translocator [Shimia sp. R9_3]